jgi:hypothetical protein
MGDAIALWFNAGSTSLAEANDARAWIERGCVLMAARNRNDADIDAIREAVEAMEAPGLEMDDMLELDIDFHAAVSRAAHNAVMELAMNAIHLVRPYTNTMLVPLLSIETIASQHLAIYEAIRAADVEAADAAFAVDMEHLSDVREKALADQRPEDVRIAAQSSEAHPQIERIRARVLGGASRRRSARAARADRRIHQRTSTPLNLTTPSAPPTGRGTPAAAASSRGTRRLPTRRSHACRRSCAGPSGRGGSAIP